MFRQHLMMIWSLSYDSLEKIEVLLFKRKLQIQNFSRSSTGRTKHNVTGHVSLEISVFVCVCLSICMSVCQWWLSSHGHRTQFQRQFNCSAVCLSVCLSVCLCVSGGCRLTVTGHNFNVSSTALLLLSNDQLNIRANATPVCQLQLSASIYILFSL